MKTWKNHSIIGANQYVVLKQISHGQLDAVRILLGKNHRNVVKYLGLETALHQDLVLEEKLRGFTLDQQIRFGKREFTERELLEIGVDICEGLQFLHSLTPPLIHGDIKPDNLMMCSEVKTFCQISVTGERRNNDVSCPEKNILIKIIDVDDAYIWQDEPVYAGNRGTPGFCSPEQQEGRLPDFSWDIYSLGKTLEFLYLGTGKKYHKRKLKKIINKMTATEASDRFVTVCECKKMLKACLASWYRH